jgi:bifunctional non-homologous end joining protein LigD
VVEALPAQATTERGTAPRGTPVYIDVMQKARGHHAVPPYVLQALPGAPVSIPLYGRELTPQRVPNVYHLATVWTRLAHQKRDPMAGLVERLGDWERC